MNKHGGYFGDNDYKVIDFSVNINPLGVPGSLIDELQNSLRDLVRYPEIDGDTGKEVIASKIGVKKDNIVVGNGATELIYLFSKTFLPKKTLIVQPTFTEYSRALKLNGSEVYSFDTDEKQSFEINIDKLVAAIDNINPNLVVMCNPNNPTGVFTHKEDIKPVLDKIKAAGGYLFVDESFIDFTNEENYISFVKGYPIFLLRSMTKTYGIPGLRLGYGIGNKDIISEMNKKKEPWTINSLALKAIPILLEDQEYIHETFQWYNKEKEFLKNELDKIDYIKTYKSYGNFFLCRLLNENADSIKDYLLDKGIYIRTCEDFLGLDSSYIRLAIRERDENSLLIKYLKNK
ncbi:threonine-phosphate decarboxylase CobD [Gottschalkia purinilytica]|uniref:threonine-phosphate decarboxylase n=1 Tax=Gottschalkia purinilytica TaxID=1503 RepID=A0A0L0W8M9_GOTPU|nr:threonine-phosphate decarboxylase CobD [Gottschalkia purinilytica]KNF07899.1 threonine-phosphate decarboxylase CobD [Gottschalkia purinilytica]